MLHPDTEERRQLQLERLQSTLNRAYRNVPFHRNRQNRVAKETGKDPSIIEDLGEIARLPFMTRAHLGEHYPYGLFAVPLRDIVRIHTAPGTSLNPTVTGYTEQDLGIWREMAARALDAAGVTSEDILQIQLDAGLANWGRDYKDGGESLSVGVIPNTPLSPEKQLMILRDYRTSALVTTPSGAFQLMETLFKTELNVTALALKRLIFVGEPVSKAFRDQVESQFHVTSWSHFGLSEVPGPAIAFECRHHEGLHINEDHFLPEIVDPETGEVLAAGISGELVLTTLTTRAFPLIRFRTGERARLIPAPCPCGVPFVRMDWLPERADDILNINGVKVHPEQIQRHLTAVLGFAPDYLYDVRRDPGERNRLEIQLGVDGDIFSDEIKMLERQVTTLRANLTENLGVPVAVRLKEKRRLND